MAHFKPGAVRKGFQSVEHIHDSIHFQFVMEGVFLFKTGRHSALLKPNDGILIPAKQIHSWSCGTSGVLFGASICITGQAANVFTDYVRSRGAGNFLFCSDPRLGGILMRIIELALKPAPFHWRRDMIGCELLLWVGQALHKALDLRLMKTPAPHAAKSRFDTSRPLCEEAARFIMSNFNRPITIHEIAGHAGVTPRHLNRLFLRYLHETAHRFLVRTRLEYADRILKSSPSLKIKEIAFASGFKTSSHFIQCFKQHFGRRPAGKI
ncbi:MAG: helix-turn-helix domain-containing protein [Kiritimatiellae bacterium]|nr:helix-turn-helix domain-containing protein [Kiritimatiellia bacterium]